MSVATERSAYDPAIRPFTIEVPDAELEALRARIAATQWPQSRPLGGGRDVWRAQAAERRAALVEHWTLARGRVIALIDSLKLRDPAAFAHNKIGHNTAIQKPSRWSTASRWIR